MEEVRALLRVIPSMCSEIGNKLSTSFKMEQIVR